MGVSFRRLDVDGVPEVGRHVVRPFVVFVQVSTCKYFARPCPAFICCIFFHFPKTGQRHNCYVREPVCTISVVSTFFFPPNIFFFVGQGLVDADIPATVGRLAGTLRRVDLSGNKLTKVPPGLLQLGEVLEELNLGNNQIAELPAQVMGPSGMLN